MICLTALDFESWTNFPVEKLPTQSHHVAVPYGWDRPVIFQVRSFDTQYVSPSRGTVSGLIVELPEGWFCLHGGEAT